MLDQETPSFQISTDQGKHKMYISAFEICLGTQQLPRLFPRKSVFSLMCVGKLLPRQSCLNNIQVNFWISYCKK